MMIKQLWTACLMAAALWPAAAMALEPVRDAQEDSLSRAVWAEDRLWLLSDAGQLFSLGEAERDSRTEATPARVRAMCVSNGRLLALTATGDKPAAWTVRSHSAAGWKTEAAIDTRGEFAITLICSHDDALILTNRRLITLKSGDVSEVALNGDLTWGLATTLLTADTVYAGFNQGEWGGGLRAIDRKTGVVRMIEHRTDDTCDGLLNTDCAPVNGLAVVPWKPDCIAAAIGMQHMGSDGHLVTICGNDIQRLYRKQFGERYANMELPEEDAYMTVAFFGLTAVGDKLLAVGGDGLYTLSQAGEPVFEAMPAFSKVGPFHISFAKPGVVLVLTTANQRHSVSGATPLLVVR